MNIAELKASIISNNVPNFLVFTGDEIGIMNIYLNEICAKFGGSVHKLESVLDATKLCSGKSIIKRNKLFIVTDDYDFIKNDKSWDKAISLLGNNKLILKYHNSDMRLGFWKHFADKTITFERMNTQILAKHLVKEFGISFDNAVKVADYCNNDYTRCQLELDKARTFSNVKNINIDDAFNECFNSGVFCFDYYSDIFSLADAILTRNYADALSIYNLLVSKDEPILKIISVLYSSFKNVLIAQTMSDGRNIYQNAGISYYVYKKAKELSGHYSNTDLENILYILMDFEQGIKTGKINPEFVVDFLLLNL